MLRNAALREPMDMPDPHFPIKLHHCEYREKGQTLFPPHFHEHMEILYFVHGEAEIECNSQVTHAKAGDLIILNSNDLHYGINLSGDLLYNALIADFSLLQSPSPDAVETKFITPMTQNNVMFRNHITDDEELRGAFELIKDEFCNRELGYELAIKSSMYRMLTILFRKYVAEYMPLSVFNSRTKNLTRFAPVFKYIEEHYLEELSVEQLARMANLSRFHFSRLFSELTNKTVTDYINQFRINKSEYLLRNTEMTISEVALAAGYNDISYFSRTFKKYKHVPPSSIRGSIKTNEHYE